MIVQRRAIYFILLHLSVLVTCQIPTDDYSGGKAVFIDTENTLYVVCSH